MRRIKEEFLGKVETVVPLKDLSVLEIGCGDGSRSIEIASRCTALHAIEPDKHKLRQALARNIPNASFCVGPAESLSFGDQSFDAIIFTLSLHHVPIEMMETAINEAVRVTRTNAYIIFLEPAQDGTFFDAEITFDACDGDERKEKVAAYDAIQKHRRLRSIAEIDDETVFQFDSVDDFNQSMMPKKNQRDIQEFLEKNNYILRASRRINICQPKSLS